MTAAVKQLILFAIKAIATRTINLILQERITRPLCVEKNVQSINKIIKDRKRENNPLHTGEKYRASFSRLKQFQPFVYQ